MLAPSGSRPTYLPGSAAPCAERMSAGNQRDSFFVIHRHATEGFADILRRRQRIRLPVGSFGIDVDKPHLHGREMPLELALTAVTLVAKPRVFRSPEDVLFGFPDVFAAAAESEGFQSHGLQCAVSGEDHEVRPRNLPPVLLLDRPQQEPRLVEVHVVGPAVQRREALRAGAGTASTIADAVRSSAMPRHPDEERSIVPVVGRPPVLRSRHQRIEILLYGLQVEALELLRIVELLVHRVGQG